MKEFTVMMLSGIISTLAFAVIFFVRKKHLIWTAFGGAIACLVYFLTKNFDVFVCNSVCAFAVTMYCEIISKIRKAPVITFLSPSIIVLVPGGCLYYTVANMLTKNYSIAGDYALRTLSICLGLAAGILVASLCTYCFKEIYKCCRRRKL